LAAVTAPSTTLLGTQGLQAAVAGQLLPVKSGDEEIFVEQQREAVWAFFRSFYGDKDELDLAGFLAHFANEESDIYQDATLGLCIDGITAITATFTPVFGAVSGVLGPGRFSKVFHTIGDSRYGAIAEYVDLKNTFYGTNGITIQTVFDLDNGLITRDTDYWDSRELGEADIVGPAVTAGVAVPLGTVHPGGVPLMSTSCVPPGSVSVATDVNGHPSASDGMLAFATDFHDALSSGSVSHVARFFTEDAQYVNPLIHQGGVEYGNFDQTIQIRGRDLIVRLLSAVLSVLPDAKGSQLIHIVGGPAGGGFEWKAGGSYAKTGLDRTGLHGCTAIDFFGNKIQRMSVKFDTFQMTQTQYDDIRKALADAGVVDQ
jgi:hypothetical protein